MSILTTTYFYRSVVILYIIGLIGYPRIRRLANFSLVGFIVSFLLNIAKPFVVIFNSFNLENILQLYFKLFNLIFKYILQNITSIIQKLIIFITFQNYSDQIQPYREDVSPTLNNIIIIIISLISIFYLYKYTKSMSWLTIFFFFFLLIGLYSVVDEIYIPKEDEEDMKQNIF